MSMSSYTVTSTTTIAVSSANPLAAHELAHACGADLDWVAQLVEVGIVMVPDATTAPSDWRFDSAALQCALEARRLERDFGVGLDAAALILDLQHEVRRLKAVLLSQGLRQP
jgi:chaperone modulatory protein CbpM